MKDYRLANVILDPEDFTEDCPELFWRVVEGEARYDRERGALRVRGIVDFCTYLNGLPIAKWRRYTCVGDAHACVTVSGDACSLRSSALAKGRQGVVVGRTPLSIGRLDGQVREATLPLSAPEGTQVVGFRIESAGETFVHGAGYHASVTDDSVRPVRLALATTTYCKEPYIERNIELVRKGVLEGPDSLGDDFHMFVVDNGRTLDAERLSGHGVSVVGNPNVGGSGGFARGMMEAEDWGATHVLLMDDDVRILPESLRRTFAVLALRNERYEDAFLSGAMLNLEHPNEFYEDVSCVYRDGLYRGIKPLLDMSDPADVLAGELVEVEVENAYAAWWYCCVPMEAIRDKGLPLPLFIRCDDVEFSLRNRPRIMCMGGICVWHEQFEGRFRASVDSYQYLRNFLVVEALHDLGVRKAMVTRFSRTFHIYLRSMAYETCELMLDGLEDYLKGPRFLEEADGEALMREKGAKNERLVPIEELSEEDRALVELARPDLSYFGDDRNRHIVMKLIEQIPHDRHLLPDRLLLDEPGPVYYSRGGYPARLTMRRKTLVAYDMQATSAHVRHIDRARWSELSGRYRRLMGELKERDAELVEEYRDAMPLMSSRAFWEDYLAARS